MKIPDNMKKRDVMEALKGKSDNVLESLYMQYNTEISNIRGLAKAGHLTSNLGPTSQRNEGYKLRNYNIAVKNRARVLTILNQRRNERLHRKGGL